MNTTTFVPLDNPGWGNRELDAKEIRRRVEKWEKDRAKKPGYCITHFFRRAKRKKK